jgi:excisionase family DNA binding protein
METVELDLLTTEEVAELCRTSARTVRWWAYEGTGPPSAKVGARRLYRRADVVAWLDAKWLAPA